MKEILALFCILFIMSCSNKINYYHGYIYNTENKPLRKIKVEEDDNLKAYSYTNEKGYFKIPKRNNFGGNLIVYSQNNTILDTIWTVFSSHGEKLNYRFVNGRKDTLFVNMKKFKTLPNNGYK